ncbi:hypothetical protein [Methylorubrum aminovorans]|uniref:hypothetical protein n=1 Tax=Methylorubrum aminovorans TaxID=269069 RepID=UPI003C2D532D
MLDAAQLARVPGILREIVILDRAIASLADHLAGAPVVDVSWGHEVRRVRSLRRELTGKARGLYGTAPLRGDTGPGRPTAARAS